jgi:hypothetical protein
MLKKIFYVCMILTFCFAPLTGCDQTSPTPPTPTPPANNSAGDPIHLDLDGEICQITVDSSYDADGKQDFEMNVVCNQRDLFFIQIDGSSPVSGRADGVDVDVFGKNFLNLGTLK